MPLLESGSSADGQALTPLSDFGVCWAAMKMTVAVSAVSVLLFVLVAQHPSFEGGFPKTNPKLLITECAQDGIEAWIPYSSKRTKVAQIDDVELDGGFPSNDEGPTFWFVGGEKDTFEASVNHFYSANAWIAIDHDRPLPRASNHARVAITYFVEAVGGGELVRVFLIDGNDVKDVSKSIDAAVTDFRTHHYCEARGNTVTALKWIHGNLLLFTQVYPTGDCGPDAGHTEGYLVSVPEGKIVRHMTLSQLKRYPGVCLENDDEN